MGHVVKIETKHGSDFAEKSRKIEKDPNFPDFSISDQRKIIDKMIKIVKNKGKKDNWMTGLDATKSLREQYEDVIDKEITMDEFNYFKSLVPKGEYGTNSIVTIIHAQEADWVNRLG